MSRFVSPELKEIEHRSSRTGNSLPLNFLNPKMMIYPRLLDGFCFPTPQNEALDACSSFLLLKPHIYLDNLKIFQVTRDFFSNNNLGNVKSLCKMSQNVALRYLEQERPGLWVSGGSNPEIITPTRL